MVGTTLLLLVPPLAAVQALLFFRETLAPIQFVGFVLRWEVYC